MVLGIPLPLHEFLQAFTGCRLDGGNLEARTLGTNAVRISMGNTADLVLRRADSTVFLDAFAISRKGKRGGLVAGRIRQRAGPHAVGSDRREEANGAVGRLFDLDLSLSQIQFAPLIMSETFSPTVPPETRSVSLEMVKRHARSRW